MFVISTFRDHPLERDFVGFCGRFRLIGETQHGLDSQLHHSPVAAALSSVKLCFPFTDRDCLHAECAGCASPPVTRCVLCFKKHFILLQLHSHGLLLFGIIFHFHCRSFIISCNQPGDSYCKCIPIFVTVFIPVSAENRGSAVPV